MRVLFLLLVFPLAGQAGWGDAFRPAAPKGPPAGLREEPDDVQAIKGGTQNVTPFPQTNVKAKPVRVAPTPQPIPVREVRLPASFPGRATAPVGDIPHAGHSCPRCGHSSYATHVVQGWVGDGRHRHRCPICSATWIH